LDFANKINNETLKKFPNLEFSEGLTQKINELIDLQPVQNIYMRLLTLHPCPKKEVLLPYISEGALAIVCIQNLLPPLNSLHKVDLTFE
jgi:hypothetical protein